MYVASPEPQPVEGKIDGGGQPGAGWYIRIIRRMSVLMSVRS
jgi:hypothetical protein